mmetsp:Transcript_50576/g.93509  ORF Transcript_50576/g.93509 Transcript_50576/m.93509 type:complete len:250 (+) Transcript_50576:727-1476(+)
MTRSAMALHIRAWFLYSAVDPMRGIMMRGRGFALGFSSIWSAQAFIMASTCISVNSGWIMPRRQPRKPSMGFSSCMALMRSTTAFTSFPKPSCSASFSVTFSGRGRNSCSGGSRSRIVTIFPSMALNNSWKSWRWNCLILSSPPPLKIHLRTMGRRSGAKNMCSVLHSPTPTAPCPAAWAASGPESAFAMTFMAPGWASAQSMMTPRSPPREGTSISMGPLIVSPVEPLIEMVSPALKSSPVLLTVTVL